MSIGASSMDPIRVDEWEWDWEVLPDYKSSFFVEVEECGNEHDSVGGKDQLLLGAKLVMVDMDHFASASHWALHGCVLDVEAKKPLPLPSQDVHGNVSVTACKDIGVVKTELKREEAISEVTEILISDTEEKETVINFPCAVKEEVYRDEELDESAAPGPQFADEDDEGVKEIGFSVGNLRARGVGALCSFGVAAATFCILLLGGKQQQDRQSRKIQLRMCADDQSLQRVMQQASRLNHTMSSVVGGASFARASISFGGYYRGF